MPEPKPLSKSQTELAKLLALFRREEMQPLIERIDKQERELAAMRDRVAQVRYCGTWSHGVEYRGSNFVTFDGSLWAALCDTRSKPLESGDWQLVCKRGRDGRDRDSRHEPHLSSPATQVPEPPAASDAEAPEVRATRSHRSNGVGRP